MTILSKIFQDALDEDDNLTDTDKEQLKEMVLIYKHIESCSTCDGNIKFSLMKNAGLAAVELTGPVCNKFQEMVDGSKYSL